MALVGLRACLGHEERIAFLLYDDAYYYLGVAKHLAIEGTSTFDGIHATNGYHPLWCALLVPVVAAIRDPGLAVRAVGLLWFALAACVPFAAWWAFRRRLGDEAAAWAAIVAALEPWIALALARPNGLETPLYALAILAVAGAADRLLGRERPPSIAGSALLGGLVGASVLARLDAGALAVAAAVLIATRGTKAWGARAAALRLAVVTSVALAVAGPSLAWNEAKFGSVLPVSGRVVALEAARERAALGGAASPAHLARRARYALADIPASIARRAALGVPGESLVARAGWASGLAAVAVLIAAGAAAWRKRCPCAPSPGDPVTLLVLFAAIHYAAYALWLWTPGEDVYRAYYFLPEILLASLLAGWWLARAGKTFAVVVCAILALHLVVESERYLRLLDTHPGRVADRFIYGWIKEQLPENAVLGARDAGKLGWFSGRTVVDLDGLIGDAAFVDVLREGREGAFVCASPIDFVLIDRPYLAGYLDELGKTATCSFRDLDPSSKDWAVLAVDRPAGGERR